MKNRFITRWGFGGVLSLGLILAGYTFAQNKIQIADSTAVSEISEGGVVTLDPNEDVSALTDFEVEIKAVQAMPTISATNLPEAGTFYSAQHLENSAEPWPPLPSHFDFPAWSLGDGFFMLDDRGYDYTISLKPAAPVKSGGGMMMMGIPGFPPDDGGTNSGGSGNYTSQVSFPTNVLWLEITGTTNGVAYLTVHNTTNGVLYEILSKQELTNAEWLSEGVVMGADGQDWTATTVWEGLRTNYLFFRARSWVDSDGSGLPDWWQLENFGHTGVDPYANPAGDGWNNLQKFQGGMNPNQFYTPPAPQGFLASYNRNSGKVTANWQAAAGNVTGYTITRIDPSTGNQQQFSLSASTNSFTDNSPVTTCPPEYGEPTYTIQATYSLGNSATKMVTMFNPNTSVAAQLTDGSQGKAKLLLASPVPSGTATLLLTRSSFDIDTFEYVVDTFDLPVSNLTGNVATVPDGWLLSWLAQNTADYYVQTVASNGDVSATALAANWGWFPPTPFFDGRRQLKDNLTFLLRAATVNYPFTFNEITGSNNLSLFPDPAPGNYAYSGIYDLNDYLGAPYSYLNPLKPFVNNYLFRNFVFSPSDVYSTNGWPNTGADANIYYTGFFTGHEQSLSMPPKYLFQAPTNSSATITNLLATNQTRWLFSTIYTAEMAGSYPVLASNTRNIFGLSYVSALGAFGTTNGLGTNVTYYNGSTIASGYHYFEIAPPQFQTAEYDFWQPGLDLLPGFSGFSTASTNHLLLAGVGNSTTIAGYAKLQLLNGYTNTFGYLGQYFTNAYTIGTNSVATTNLAGILSPYGEFVPTVPGPAALVTMPDIDTGARGTCTVYSVSLQLDANHDSVMDLSFTGPDNTSSSKPFRFWVNNDHDYSGNSTDLGHDVSIPPANGGISPSADCVDQGIESQRDLEDFARLWICGMPALATNGNYQVTLSWNVSSGSPAINLFNSVETNGAIGYLTNSTVANAQIAGNDNYVLQGPGWQIGTVTPSQSFTFSGDIFTNSGNKYFLFEGSGIGTGELVMTISQGSNVLAQTSAWLDLHDVKDFYERTVITNNTSGVVSNWSGSIQTVQPASSSALGDDSDFIVLVHGINVGYADWLVQSDTVLKRLYWAGFHGKFSTVKWPCEYFNLPTLLSVDTEVFNRSEIKAYKAGIALKTYLNQLRTRLPDYRLHILAHSQGNAITSEAIKSGAPFDTYILTQGAMPDSAYDVSATNNTGLVNAEATYGPTPEWQPKGYRGVYTNLTGRIVNFYNPNDPVLAVWVNDQGAAKPNAVSDYHYDGTNGIYNPPFGSSYVVTDMQESRAFVSRSRTLSIGQSPPESAHGIIQSAINLNTRYGFDDAFPGDHSAQWVWPIQTTRPYFQQVLTSCQIQPAP